VAEENERTEAEREQARLAREAARRKKSGAGDFGPTPPPVAKPVLTEHAAPPRAQKPLKATKPPKAAKSLRSAKSPRPAKPPRAPRAVQPAKAAKPPQRRPRSSRRPAAFIAIFVLVVVIAVVAWFLISLLEPFTGSGSGKVSVRIPADASSSEVGDLLAKDKVVSSSFFFKLRTELGGDHFTAGRYELRRGMSYGAALSLLAKGPAAIPVANVTIIPGKSRYQLNALLKSQHVAGSYLKSTLRSPLLNPTAYGAPRHLPSLEGFLYPDTYQLRKPIKIPALVADQLRQFKQEMKSVNLRFAKSKNLTAYDVLTIASLEEAEAALPSDLPKVASVIYNRLQDGMDLGLDTTAAYAANNYSGNLTAKQLSSSSPWNTLDHPGLPPTPINSPDLAAINAAAHPAATRYTYFIVKVCGNGALNFTASYQQFLTWSRQYSQSLAAKGATKTEFCRKRG
jgi:UPF0755 protein